MNVMKYCSAEFSHAQVLDLSYHELKIMLIQHFTPCAICQYGLCSHARLDLMSA
jgi:hypothetical protein